MAAFIDQNGLRRPTFVEAFAGGASVALGLLSHDVVERAVLVERDPLVYAFWKCVEADPDRLCERVWNLDISLATWKRFQRFQADDALKQFDLFDLGAAAIFFNRANFSGVIGAKPIGGLGQRSAYGIDCRWNPARLTRQICEIAVLRPRLTAVFGDAVSFLRRKSTWLTRLGGRGALVYLDPPYFVQGWKLYRYHFKPRDHGRLALFLHDKRWPWLVSYDEHRTIRDLYDGQTISTVALRYSVRAARGARELIITNQAKLPRGIVRRHRVARNTS